jgi:hypothetical protein
VRIEELRERVLAEFGPDLSRATPASVTEFLTRLEAEEGGENGCLEMGGYAGGYDRIIRTFLGRMLAAHPDDSVVPLWKFCLQLAFSMEEQHEAARLEPLFGDPL